VTLIGWSVAVLLGWCMTTLLVNAAYTTEGGLAPGGGQRTFIAFALAGLSALTGFCCYLPFGRRLAARWLPIDSSSFTAATGLALAIPLTMYSLIPLAVTGKVAVNLADAGSSTEMAATDFILPALGVQLVWLVLFAIVAGGFPVRRNWADTLNRLGVRRISLPVIGVAIVIAVAMVGVVLPMEVGVHSLWQRMGWPTTDEKALEQMLGGVKSWYGAIVIGFVAGISEELLVRGLLQPRLGLILSNLLFAAAHAYQYCWDGLLVVFFIGLICGLVRKYYNTTASMIVHGLYDTILVLLATYAADWVH
jgi:membrane protease YdiL (CAAX protease family)